MQDKIADLTASHGIAIAIGTGIDIESINARLAKVAAGNEGAGPLRLWVETIDVQAHDELAFRRYQLRELGRPLASSGPGIRIVLLKSLDGAQSLVLVARRGL